MLFGAEPSPQPLPPTPVVEIEGVVVPAHTFCAGMGGTACVKGGHEAEVTQISVPAAVLSVESSDSWDLTATVRDAATGRPEEGILELQQSSSWLMTLPGSGVFAVTLLAQGPEGRAIYELEITVSG
jgi:hypothetical protein